MATNEFGILFDPKTATVHSYQKPDGTWAKTADETVSMTTIINPEYFIADANNDDKPRDTLAYRVAHMLIGATKLYGPRDPSFTFAGVEFTPDNPHIRFYQNNHAIIQLHTSALFDRNEMWWQLAHECVHLLSPTPERPVKILEEGMAVTYAYLYMRDNLQVTAMPQQRPSYQEAAELVSRLLNVDKDGIRKLREEEPAIANISKALIMKHYPTIPEGVAARLTRTFVVGEDAHPDIIRVYNSEIGQLFERNRPLE